MSSRVLISLDPTIALIAGQTMPVNEELIEISKQIGRQIGEEGLSLVFSGGVHGLGGVVAQEAYNAGAKVRAVVCRNEQDDDQLEGLMPEIVKDPIARFNRYARDESIKGFIVLPGIETISDTMFALDLRMKHQGPPVLLTKLPQLKPMHDLFNSLVGDGFIEPKNRRALKQWEPGHSLRGILKIQTPSGYTPGMGSHTG